MGSRKNRKGVVYSTNPDFNYQEISDNGELSVSPDEQLLYVSHDSKKRKGKVVTLVEGFDGSMEELKDLEKYLKTKCGVGGSSKDGIIIVQGPLKLKVKELLVKEGYRVKLKN